MFAIMFWNLVSQTVPTIGNWIKNNPVKSMWLGGFLGSPLIDRYLKRKATRQLQEPVYQKLMKGSKPLMPRQDDTDNAEIIPRPEIMKDLEDLFLPEPCKETDTRFGIVMGPSGSGKTYAVRNLCNLFPQGVLYYEVKVPGSFVEGLSKEVGMKTSPSTILDLALGYFSPRYTHYYMLPGSQVNGIGLVLEVLEKAASQFKVEFGRIPVLIIDGVDLLAKHDEELCLQLITLSKILANTNQLKVILVSSEGSIVPMLEGISATNRGIMYEIGDIKDEDAIYYLMKRGIGEDKAKKLVKFIGGRLVYLQTSVALIKKLGWTSQDGIEKMKSLLFSRKLNAQKATILQLQPESGVILDKLSKKGTVTTVDLTSVAQNKLKMEMVIKNMIEANILRYCVDGAIKFHGRVQQDELGNK